MGCSLLGGKVLVYRKGWVGGEGRGWRFVHHDETVAHRHGSLCTSIMIATLSHPRMTVREEIALSAMCDEVF